MLMSLMVIGMTGLLAFIWASRGFFSAMLHMVCTLIAGAVAFGLWEVVGTSIRDGAPTGGTFSFLEGVAFALALGGTFAVSLGVLRAITDVVLRANVQVSMPVNYIGGSICGAVSAVITMGVLVLSVGQQRYGRDLFGWQPVDYSTNGSIVRQGGLWLPVDRITAGLYSHFSTTTFRTGESLAKWHPDFADIGPTQRITFEGRNRTSARPEQVSLVGRFTAGGAGRKLDDFLTDSQSPGKQNVSLLSGGSAPQDSRVEGFTLRVSSGAAEKNGKITVGAGQVRLVAIDDRGVSHAYHPIAVASLADAAAGRFGRWRFDSRDTFIASVGGGAETILSFEFAVPNGQTPLALYFKGARVSFDPSMQSMMVSSAGMRDGVQTNPAAALGGKVASIDTSNLDTSSAKVIKLPPNSPFPENIRMGNTIGLTIQEGLHSPLELTDKREVVQGELTLATKDLQGMIGIERNLRIEQFVVPNDVALVHVKASGTSEYSFLNAAISTLDDRNVPIILIDDKGEAYQPIGFIYKDEGKTVIRYTPQQPLRSVAEIDVSAASLSRSRPTQELTLIFRVSQGVNLRYYAAGSKVLVQFDPGLRAGSR